MGQPLLEASPAGNESEALPAQMPPVDCDDCGACCRGRSGTVPILTADCLRWAAAGRADLLDSRVEGHFGEQGLAVDSLGDCVHLAAHRCTIYRHRPDACRDFELGCAQCLAARRCAARRPPPRP